MTPHTQIQLLSVQDPIPYPLLLLADETKEAIDKYIHQCVCVVMYDTLSKIHIGVLALYPINSKTLEIKNIAIAQSYQRLGLGKQLLEFAKQYATTHQFKELLVGTGDHSYEALSFYQSNGFTPYDTRKNFYIDNYPQPIIEHGKQLTDMILLKQTISS